MDTGFVTDAYESHGRSLYGYLYSITRDADVAQDAVQESYARLARQVNEGRTPDHARAWLYQVGRNLVISRGRRQQVAERLQHRVAEYGYGTSAEDGYLRREETRELRAALAQTSATDRTALLMAAQGYTGAEIAKVVGLSEAAVRARLCRARSRMRQRLLPSIPAA